MAGFVPSDTASFPGAAKLESLGPNPPAKPLLNFDPKTLPLARPPNPDDAPVPNPKPDDGFAAKDPNPLGAGAVVVDVADPELANDPKPDVPESPPPNTLGFEAPRLPKPDVLEDARDAKPELAKAEFDVWGGFASVILGEGRDFLS